MSQVALRRRSGAGEDELERAYDVMSETSAPDAWSFLPKPKNQHEKSARRNQIKTFVLNTLRKGPQGLIAEFRAMKRGNDFTKMTEFLAQNPNGKNRYKDVGCLDNNRVILTVGSCSYIHANYVSTPDNPKRFICTQAPLPSTCAEFWCMVVQESSDVILMLCNFIEQKAKKCAEYYPTKDGELYFNDIVVQFKRQEEFVFPFETKIKLEVTYLDVQVPGHPTHSCTHYHWVDWPDRCVPPADAAPLFLLNSIAYTRTPIVIHCSAGIGRTGSIVLLQHAMEVLEKGENLAEMNGYLLELRTQRNNSVQTDQQYLYVHQVLLTYFRSIGFLPETILPALDAFTAAYNSATTGF